jgi:DNA (cytosine-5)-methyltransferase 1
MDELRLIDTFSGIGGFSYAAEKLVKGFKTVSFVECEPFCQKVLKKHWPDVPIYEDIKTYRPEPYSAEVICGGFPCQSISNAGKREGITETSQSGLWYELYRVICLLQPQYVVLENVSAILSRGLGIVLGNLAEAGYCCEYACIPASYIGACHQRDRWWLVAYSTSVSDGSQIEIQARGNTFIRSSTANTEGYFCNDGKFKNSKAKREKHRQFRGSDRILTNPMFKGSQGLRAKHELQKSSKERSSTWRNCGITLEQDWKRYISKPTLCRGDDGIPNWLHRSPRLKALGNSIVPQVAAIPLQRVLDLHRSAIHT